MGNNPQKTQQFRQGINEISSTQKEAFGTLRVTQDGRKFRYAKATAAAMEAGIACQMAVPTANHFNRSAVATAVGSIQVDVAVGATAVTANQYDGGYLQINAGTAGTIGRQYLISSHTVSAAGSETITVNLAEPLATALVVTTDKLSLIPNPYNGVSVGAVAEPIAGICPVKVTASYYFWCQTGGIANAMIDNAVDAGSCLVGGGTGTLILHLVNYLQPIVGYAIGIGITSECKAAFLTID
jgi:hypothetical protein